MDPAVVHLGMAAICGAVAYKQDRSVAWGIIFGLLFGGWTLIVYLIIGKKNKY